MHKEMLKIRRLITPQKAFAISCRNCGEREESTDRETLSALLTSIGWRVVGEYAYCMDCVEEAED